MGSLKIKIDCRTEGPLANGEAEKAAQEWAENTTQAVADKGAELLREFPMDKTGRASGGFQRELQPVRKSPTQVNIAGRRVEGVTWGPWLEGTSKRNEGNGFKGYHLFRATRRELNKLAPDIAQDELKKVLPRMGGE
jgi:hypothetical protein